MTLHSNSTESCLSQLEINVNRGVIYVHSLLTGQTVLRVCRIPDDLMQLFWSGMVSLQIDLKRTPTRREGCSMRRNIAKTDPVCIKTPDSVQGDVGGFSIVDSMGRTLIEFTSVPMSVMLKLWTEQFVDITIGYTGVNPGPTGRKSLAFNEPATGLQRQYIENLLKAKQVPPEKRQEIIAELEDEVSKLTKGEAGRWITRLKEMPGRKTTK